MQVNWHLGAEFETKGKAKETDGDQALSAGDVSTAWHAYTMAAEHYRLGDRPMNALRLFQVAYGLVEDSSVPWIVTALHHIGSLVALGRYEPARHVLESLNVLPIPSGLQSLHLDLSVGVYLGCGNLALAKDAVDRFQHLEDPRARLGEHFRKTELLHLEGNVDEALRSIAHTRSLLDSQANADAGLAALCALKSELFVLSDSLEEAEEAQRQACVYLVNAARLGPLLGAMTQWVWVRHLQGLNNDWSWLNEAYEWCIERHLMSTAARVSSVRGLACDSEEKGRPFFVGGWELADQHHLPRTASMCRYIYALQYQDAVDRTSILQRAYTDANISRPLRILIERQMC